MDSFPQARIGIQLAQQGRRTEAIHYLRQATRQEPQHPEVWLWLAHVTPSLEEYRYCVQQAIRLAPHHQTARQMEAALRNIPALPAQVPNATLPNTDSMNVRVPSQPFVVDEHLVNRMQRQRKKRSLRQKLILFTVITLVIGLLGAVGIILGRNLIENSNSNTATPHELWLTIQTNTQTLPIRFRMQTPPSWIVADAASPQWASISQSLAEVPAIQANWAGFAANLSAIQINPADDSLETPVTIVETNFDSIIASGGYPLRLQLIRLGAIYASMDDASCTGLQQLAAEQQNTIATSGITATILENQVVQQPSGNCVYVIHYFGTSAISGQDEHIYVIYVPVGTTSLAEWHLTVVDISHDQYRPMIEQLLESIRAL
ncbi:MAG: hypothetical protein CUN55_03295 [Phototrophicales bacterium]|nr:MAG: hypothetical protein CUN55_03295 [Phototrophicales bacterium]